MNIKQEFITPNRYTRPQLSLHKVTKIAVHYAGDPGATAQNIRDYFNGTCVRQRRYASCHFAVGMSGEVIQLIPLNEWSYCTNQANSYSVSIETCHPDSSGKFTEASEKSLIELVAYLCKQYRLNPLSGGIVRHYDVTGKECPYYYVTHPQAWATFKTAVANCMSGAAYTLPCSGKAVGTFYAKSDTTGNFSVKDGHVYQFKITTSGAPTLVAGSSSFTLFRQSCDGNNHFFVFKAIGKPGDGCGFYLNGARKPVAVATIK